MARILIIDDDVDFLKMLRQMLEHAGHTVIDAPNGMVGAKLFREERPELMITDIFMPEQEGIQTIMELKREFPTMRIIAMSGGGGRKGSFGVLERAEILGADRSLSKPFARQEMLKAIRELVDEEEF